MCAAAGSRLRDLILQVIDDLQRIHRGRSPALDQRAHVALHLQHHDADRDTVKEGEEEEGGRDIGRGRGEGGGLVSVDAAA